MLSIKHHRRKRERERERVCIFSTLQLIQAIVHTETTKKRETAKKRVTATSDYYQSVSLLLVGFRRPLLE